MSALCGRICVVMSDWSTDPRSSFELADRMLRAGHSLRRTVGGLMAVRERTRERLLSQPASGYARALREPNAPREVARAA